MTNVDRLSGFIVAQKIQTFSSGWLNGIARSALWETVTYTDKTVHYADGSLLWERYQKDLQHGARKIELTETIKARNEASTEEECRRLTGVVDKLRAFWA